MNHAIAHYKRILSSCGCKSPNPRLNATDESPTLDCCYTLIGIESSKYLAFTSQKPDPAARVIFLPKHCRASSSSGNAGVQLGK
ncbi:hypothetical protein KSP40_PGU022782 [Platanthera guangdongensis]|uniref:Uncharacterized protein n=1 Tax=Platanthera guangdongensis TaxID=2320717 RepID=A0ABR2M9X4_9ASPA